jgi:carbon-monoxide dehydrogenase medium subunit
MTTMRPVNFEYHRPTSVAEAAQMLANTDGAKALAGGHSLIPAMNLRLAAPSALVDIGRLSELRGISANGSLSIGALSTHNDVATSRAVQQYAPALADAASHIGDPHVRNWGTIGGNIAHADPASDPPTVILAYNGTIHTQGAGGGRSIDAKDFFVDLFTTDLQDGELITRIEIANHSGHRAAYVKMAHPASRYAVLGVCVVLGLDGGVCRSASVAVGGAVAKATKSAGAESALVGSSLDDGALQNAANALMDEIGGDVIGDVYAPAHYRRAMAGVYLKRAIHEALAG